MSEGERSITVHVTGRVQGVSYRAYTRDQAVRLGVTGWVVNRDDGSVDAALFGRGDALAELVGLMRRGPPHAAVEGLDVRSTDRARTREAPPEHGVSF